MGMTLNDVFLAARGRNVLPMALATREARLAFAEEVRRQAVFSARTASIPYLSIVRDTIEALLRTQQIGPTGLTQSIGHAEAHVRLKLALEALHYDPERGHFGLREDAQVPPARPGSIQDLSSDRRLDLIIDTQRMLWQSAAQKTRAQEPISLRLFPALELRPGYARVPRKDWRTRWLRVGGTLYEGRLIAPVGDPIWARLGNGQTFDDALDTDTPPFAFGSTRAWREVSRDECLRLGVPVPPPPPLPKPADPEAAPESKPPPADTPPAVPPHDIPSPKVTVPPDANPRVVDAVTVTLKVDPSTEYERFRAAQKERTRLEREAKRSQIR